MKDATFFRSLSDQDITNETRRLATRERLATADFIACLEEFDRRRLYLGLGYSSLYTYCIHGLRLGEGATYRRVAVAKAARRFPLVLQQLRDGSLTLGSLALLARVLTESNHARLLSAAVGKTKADVELLVASVQPTQDVRTSIRKAPAPRPAAVVQRVAGQLAPLLASSAVCEIAIESGSSGTGSADRPERDQSRRAQGLDEDGTGNDSLSQQTSPHAHRPEIVVRPLLPSIIVPLTPERYKIQITVSREAHDNLRRLQALMRHTFPTGDAALIIERAIVVLLDRVQARKLGMLKKDRAGANLKRNAG